MSKLEKILVIDNDVHVLELLKDFLCDEYDIIPTLDLTSAKKLLATNEINLVFCDMELNSECGLDFIKHLNYNYPTIPSAIITGSTDNVYLINAVRLGATDFIYKPFNRKEILSVACRLIEINKKLSKAITLEKLKEHRLINGLKIRNSMVRTEDI